MSARRRTTETRIVLLFLMLFIYTDSVYSKEAYWNDYHIEHSGVSDEQLSIIEETIAQLRSLESGELKINVGVYNRLSRFKYLFGTSFNGEVLVDWLLRRIRRISYHNSWTAAVNQNKGTFVLGDMFFSKLTTLERLYLLIHEARHSDHEGHRHIKCPEGFKFVSAAQPHMNLEDLYACDDSTVGAYAFQASFLFELFAYDLFKQQEVGLLYNSSISRVIPCSIVEQGGQRILERTTE